MRYTEGRFMDSRGRRFFYRVWRSQKAKAIFVLFHALGLHSGRYSWFCEELSYRGFTCYAVDLHGHGLSDGPRGGSLKEILSSGEKFLKLIRSKHGDSKLVVAGHGCGALVAFKVLEPAVLALVMLAPAHEIRPYSRGAGLLKLLSPFGVRVRLYHRPLYDVNHADALLEVEEDSLIFNRATAELVLGFTRIAESIASRGIERGVKGVVVKDGTSASWDTIPSSVEVVYDPRREPFPFDNLLEGLSLE